MGCFLGCFGGGAKDSKRRKEKVNRGSPIIQRDGVQNVQQQQGVIYAEQSITETLPTEIPTTKLVSDLGDKPEEEEQLISSVRKRVTFDSNVTTYSHISINESTDSLPENVEKLEEKDLESAQVNQLQLKTPENYSFVASNIGLYPPNHRYHNVMDGNDELEEYGDSDLDDLDDQDDDEIACEEIESPLIKTALSESNEVEDFGLTNVRDRGDCVLKPIENATQWKTVKLKGTMQPLKPQKENLVANLETPRISFSSLEPTFKQSSHGLKAKLNNEIAVDSSLSRWLVSSDVTPSKDSCSDCETNTSAKNISPRSFDDRPILGALTVEQLKEMSGSSSPRKSPGRNPDEMPIIGTVGTYWNDLGLDKNLDSASSFKGIPNTTSKYREDKRVNWHSTPFETRLERALNRGVAKS